MTPVGHAGTDLHTVWLGLGSNVGVREDQLAAAVRALRTVLHVDALSPVYETTPVGYADQPDFLNMVVRGTSVLEPAGLLGAVKDLERELGREATFRMGPRTIDIDILLYDDVVLDVPGLRVPHPGLTSRAFVLAPLLELDPGLGDPVSGRPLAEFLQRTGTAGLIRVGDAGQVLPDSVNERTGMDGPHSQREGNSP
ncbi:MAG TPA: 2-amino-4-hydroxy-6-hydroxymethyldihydropteridine diphosphokinase [Longimicrobiales bacterium]|nr:2-amino-4-hydroxy-6-hydroxymethyldihydropteridine diphosphokinase [Longimicrobiales bacterium]